MRCKAGAIVSMLVLDKKLANASSNAGPHENNLVLKCGAYSSTELHYYRWLFCWHAQHLLSR